MRDNLKNKDYFEKYINESNISFQKSNQNIISGIIPNERILIVKRSLAFTLVQILFAKYSLGNSIQELKDNLIKAIELSYQSWDGFWLIKHNGKTLDQYSLGAYDEMLWMLSLGYLLDIAKEDFRKLVEIIDRDNVKDHLFEFIIRAKIKDRKPLAEESYREFFGVPKVFEKLRQAITETNKAKAEKLVNEFISKDWYKNHKDSGWYNSHNNKHNTYFGYWSFETAAVVKIMSLNDSSLSDNQYFPKDLVQPNIVQE